MGELEYGEHAATQLVYPGVMAAVVSATFLVYKYLQPSSNLPPGPTWLPIIGGLHIFTLGDSVKHFHDFIRAYGDVARVCFGSSSFVFLNSPEAVREAFVKKADVLSARPKQYLIEIMTRGKGIAMVDGPVWREQRKFTVGVFRDIGVGKIHFEDKIQDSIAHLLEFLRVTGGRTIDPGAEISKSVGNVIGDIVFGSENYERDSPETARYITCLSENFANIESGTLLDDFPFLRYLPGDMFNERRTRSNQEYMVNYCGRSVQWHREHPPPEGECRDFIDAYLQKMAEVENTSYGASADFSDAQLLQVINDLFTAGIDTTSSTLKWAFLYMAANQDIQTRVREELETVFPSGQPPSLHRRAECKYTDAVLYEVQRIGSVAPYGLPHLAEEDVTIGGYHIPKGTMVMPNIYTLHHSERYWDNPHVFNPDRFLDSSGELGARHEAFMPFSAGRRMCLGDSLARMEIFLFFASVMQMFSVSFPAGEPEPSVEGVFGLTLPPEPYKATFTAVDKET